MKKKIRLGKQTEDGYKYAAKGNLGPDLTTQVEEFVKEKEVKDLLKKEAEKLSKIVKGFRRREKKNNLSYYHAMMYYLGKVDREDLSRATWWQWYEIVKFPALFTNSKKYKKILGLIERKDKKGPVRSIIKKSLKKP